MSGPVEKVVRIEKVSPSDDFKDIVSFTSPVPELSELQRKTSMDTNSTTSESTLPSLPSKWPLIPQLHMRHYWDFSTCTDPSIKKATELLELLQTAIEDRSLATQERESSRLVTSSEGKRQLKSTVTSLTEGANDHDEKSTNQERLSTAGSLVSKDILTVQGIGAMPPSTAGDQVSESLPIPYLGADEVLDEITTLLAHLEKDRLETKNSLEQEKIRSQTLAGKIDKLAETRMLELPASVQREHEACAMDINELNWHVSYRSRILERIENKVKTAEALHVKVTDDIAFVQQHCPLVEEKLELEKTAMTRIRNAQQETNEELANTVERCAKTENKSEEAFSKAEAERTHIKNDLAAVNRDLVVSKEELTKAKATYQNFIAKCEDCKQRLEKNHQELTMLEIQCENARVREVEQEARIKDYEAKIIEEKWEKKRLSEDNIMKEGALEKLIRNHACEVESLDLKIQEHNITLRKVTRSNQEYELDNEDCRIKIKQCERQRVADQKNLARMEKERDRTEDQIASTEEQLTKVRIINDSLHKKLQSEKEKYCAEEEELMATAAELQRTVENEKHRKTVLQARIISNQKSYEQDKQVAQYEEEKAKKSAAHAEKQMKAILEKVKVQRDRYAKHLQVIETLEAEMVDIEAQQKELELQHKTTKNQLEPKIKEEREEQQKWKLALDDLNLKINNMQQNIKDMTSFQQRMQKTTKKTQAEIHALHDEIDELNVQISTKQHIINETKSQLDQVNARFRDHEKNHKELIKERLLAFEQTKEDYSLNIKLNEELAAKYRKIQNQYILLKNRALDKYNQCLTQEEHLKDLKQVKGLQSKLHHALMEYYKLRGIYNTSELERVADETHNNASKVGELKSSMDFALNGIKEFLSNDMKPSRKMPKNQLTNTKAMPSALSAMQTSQHVLTAVQ